MKKKLMSLACFLCCIGIVVHLSRQQPISIESLDELKPLIDQSNDQTVWMFNIDDITYPADQIGQHISSDELRRAAHKAHPTLIRPSTAAETMSVMLKQAARPLVDPSLPTLLNILKKKQALCVGIGNLPVGTYGEIQQLDEWRYQKLLEVGIDFYHPSLPQELVFSAFEPLKHNHNRYYRGLLLSHDDKLNLLVGNFLDAFTPRPEKVFYCDYSTERLAHIQQAVEQRGMKFVGIHFKGSHKHYAPTIDLERAVFQLGYLMDKKIWLNDQQASAIMLTQPKLVASHKSNRWGPRNIERS